tara:strand:+ start:2562 stop:2822 length:261 start_codon:yes stop_codon:yes gene_type:complete
MDNKQKTYGQYESKAKGLVTGLDITKHNAKSKDAKHIMKVVLFVSEITNFQNNCFSDTQTGEEIIMLRIEIIMLPIFFLNSFTPRQ